MINSYRINLLEGTGIAGTLTLGMISQGVLISAIALYAAYKIVNKFREIKRIKEYKRQADLKKYRDNLGRTPLMTATSVKECEVVYERGCDINAVDKQGNTALMYAKKPKVISWLIDHGADVNAVNADNETSLIQRAKCWDTDSMNALCEKGADASLKDKYGKTALYYYLKESVRRARNGVRRSPYAVVVNEKIIEALLEEGKETSEQQKKRENTKKTMSLQGVKGHKRVNECEGHIRNEQTSTVERPQKQKNESKKTKTDKTVNIIKSKKGKEIGA